MYISKILKNVDIKVTRIASGVPVGGARLQRASASSGVAAPQGCGVYSLVTAWSFLRCVGVSFSKASAGMLLRK